MIADYHIHTPYCGHAQGKIVDYVEAAIRAGVTEMGFADHLERYYLSNSQRKRYWNWGMDQDKLFRYIDEVHAVQEAYKDKIAIRVGLEVDYVEGAEELVSPLLAKCPLDFVLGSVHCIPAFGWRHLAEVSHSQPVLLYQEYFAIAHAALESGLFDALAHLDFIWRYVKWPALNTQPVLDWIGETVALAARQKRAIEINANGYLWSQLYRIEDGDPFDLLLDQIAQQQTAVTVGSDAHAPQFVAKAFGELLALLKKKGIRTITTFQARRPVASQLG